MSTDTKREFSPEVCLSTSLVMAGTELIEMAGATTERGSASDFNLKRAEKAVRKAAEALAEYRRLAAADPVIMWDRPSYHRQAEGLRCEDRTIPLQTLAALNGDDTPDEAA